MDVRSGCLKDRISKYGVNSLKQNGVLLNTMLQEQFLKLNLTPFATGDKVTFNMDFDGQSN